MILVIWGEKNHNLKCLKYCNFSKWILFFWVSAPAYRCQVNPVMTMKNLQSNWEEPGGQHCVVSWENETSEQALRTHLICLTEKETKTQMCPNQALAVGIVRQGAGLWWVLSSFCNIILRCINCFLVGLNSNSVMLAWNWGGTAPSAIILTFHSLPSMI